LKSRSRLVWVGSGPPMSLQRLPVKRMWLHEGQQESNSLCIYPSMQPVSTDRRSVGLAPVSFQRQQHQLAAAAHNFRLGCCRDGGIRCCVLLHSGRRRLLPQEGAWKSHGLPYDSLQIVTTTYMPVATVHLCTAMPSIHQECELLCVCPRPQHQPSVVASKQAWAQSIGQILHTTSCRQLPACSDASSTRLQP
jgi:hypothetical protein